MKKILILLIAVLLLSANAIAEVDLSGMSYDELVTLKDQINLALWNSSEWQEVTVPQGVWQVGVDIPAGHWTIKAADGANSIVRYGDVLDENGKDVKYSSGYYSETIKSPSRSTFKKNEDVVQIDIVAKEGFYFAITFGNVVFTPYSGKPSLGFK